MSELNSRARALIHSMQHADEPTQDDYDRVHAALEARIAVGVAVGVAVTLAAEAAAAAPGTTVVAASAASAAVTGTAVSTAPAAVAATAGAVAGSAAASATAVGAGAAGAAGLAAAGTTAPAAAAVGTALMTKVAAWVMVAGAVAAGTATVARHSSSAPAPVAVVATAAPTATTNVTRATGRATAPRQDNEVNPAPASPPAKTDDSDPVVLGDTPGAPIAPPAIDTSKTKPTLPVARVPQAARASGAVPEGTRGSGSLPQATVTTAAPVAVATTPVESAPPSSLDAEVASLRVAREALRRGAPDQALAVLEQDARRFPNGSLAEDRAAERIFALCALGRTDEARAEVSRFLADHPRSSYSATVRASCGLGVTQGPAK
jgi:hypothetical protein